MNFIKDNIEYLKDNPEGYWFKRKLYGYGWTPARPQGWMVVIGYVIAILFLAFRLDESVTGEVIVNDLFIPVAALTVLLVIISYKKGEKPKWQWGLKKDDNELESQ